MENAFGPYWRLSGQELLKHVMMDDEYIAVATLYTTPIAVSEKEQLQLQKFSMSFY